MEGRGAQLSLAEMGYVLQEMAKHLVNCKSEESLASKFWFPSSRVQAGETRANRLSSWTTKAVSLFLKEKGKVVVHGFTSSSAPLEPF